MAVIDWNNITSITREKVIPKIIDQIGKDQPLFGRFINKTKVWDGGTSLEQPVKYRHNSQGGSYQGLEVLDSGQEITRTRAKIEVKQKYQPIVVSNIDVAINGGQAQIAGLLETEMSEAKDSLKDKFCTSLFSDGTADGGKDMTGLEAMVDDGTNTATYAGIDRTSYAWWKANYTASVGALTLAKMATMYDSCTHGQKTPTIIVTTRAINSAYEALLQSQVRFSSDSNGYEKADGGLRGLSFRGTIILVDEYCPAGEMYMLNENFIDLWHMKHPVHSTNSRGFSVTPMREPINQDGQLGYVLFYGQYLNIQPRLSGRMAGIS